MNITSPAFINNGSLPDKYTFTDENINPPLIFEHVPAGTQSLVLFFQDRDAEPKAFTHWLVFNISPQIRLLEENSVPENAIVGKSSNKKRKYQGPNLKDFSGEHQCVFTAYALDTTIKLSSKADTTQVLEAMIDHIIDRAELICDVYGYQQISVQAGGP